MKAHLGLLVLVALPALAGAGSTAVYTGFDEAPPEIVIDAMRAEIESILAPGGLRVAWRTLDGSTTSESFDELAVARFKGSCTTDGFTHRGADSGPLAWSHVSDGQVLPFADVDCNRIDTFLQDRFKGMDRVTRERTFGRALGRVLAHELFHIFGRTLGHGSRTVDRPYYSASDLTAETLRADNEFHVLAKAPKPRHADPVLSDAATFAKAGCSRCHGARAEGSRKAPSLGSADHWIDTVVLAARLEKAGPRMAHRARGLKLPLPSLSEEDLGRIVRFLNASR